MERGLGFLAACLTTALAVPFWRRRLRSDSWVDSPREDRHNSRATPKVGGAAWLVGVTIGISFLWSDRASLDVLRLLGPLFLAAALGRWDDLGRLVPGPKFLIQLLVLALGFLLVGQGTWETRSGSEWGLGVLLVLTIHLALHIGDHLDGLLASVSVASLLGVAMWGGGSGLVVDLALTGGGAGLGFLLWNRPPASVFFGNMGSGVVAWWSSLVLLLLWFGPGGSPQVRWEWILPFSWPFVDFVFVCTTRIRRGISPWTGGSDHLAHRASRRWGDRIAWLIVWGVSGAGALLAAKLSGQRG